MKFIRFQMLAAFLCLFILQPGQSQNKKLDKSLSKADAYYKAGSFSKALKAITKVKAGALKISSQNNYVLAYFIREARINLAMGIVDGFENSLNNALVTSKTVYGETSTSYANTILDVGEIYIEYGNYRIAREYIEQAEALLQKTSQLNEVLKGRVALLKAEALIGQGFVNEAIELLGGVEKYFVARAVDKETTVENGQIKSTRLDEAQIFSRHNDYAQLKTLLMMAYAKKGRISVIGSNGENPDVDVIYRELSGWLKNKRRYLGETSLAEVRANFLWAKAFEENGSKIDLGYDRILNDLKRKTAPTNNLAHEIYLSYISFLLDKGNRPRYLNTKLEYEKMIDKYYPKSSLHQVKLRAVEFNSKFSRDKTRNIENEATAVIGSKTLPKYYSTRVRILEFLYDVAISEHRYANAEGYLNQLAEIKKELCGETSPEYHVTKVALANFYLDYTNKIEEAGKIYQESYYNLVAKEIGEQHKDLINILNHLAQWYEMTDKYQLASKTLKDAHSAVSVKFDNRDILFGMGLTNIAKLQLKLGDYDEADTNIQKALEVIDLKDNREYNEYGPAYISALETQARLYGIKGLFDEAEGNLARTRKIISRSEVPIGDEMSTAKELSSLFIQLGKYSETEKLLDNLIREYEELFGNTTLRLIEPLVDKGRILLA